MILGYNLYPDANLQGNCTRISGTITFTSGDLIWAYLRMGRLTKSSQMIEHLKFSANYIDYNFRTDGNNRIILNDEVRNLDQSIKTAFSYLNGMLICMIFAYRNLNIRFLYHFDNNKYQLNKTGRYKPDLFGETFIGGNNEYWVFESKATMNNSVSSQKKNYAFIQLNSINTVNKKTPKKYASLTSVNSATNQIQLDMIDPKTEGKIDYDLETSKFEYYKKMALMFSKKNSEERMIDNMRFMGYNVENYFVGIDVRVIEMVKKKEDFSTEIINEIYSNVNVDGIYNDGFCVLNEL